MERLVYERATSSAAGDRAERHSAAHQPVRIGIELSLIALWTLFVTAPYLNFDVDSVPIGREYLSGIQTHYLWTRAVDCGWCALWNGSVHGGSPAFADVFSSALHPFVALTTLSFGVINGSKLTLVLAFLMCGLAQWWLGRVIGLGGVARVWTACMAVAAGHLAGTLELGMLGMVLSAAGCALALPPMIMVSRTGSRRSAVLLGVALALVAVSGLGYMQIGLAFLFPTVLILSWGTGQPTLLARRYGLAFSVAILLAAPFVLPFMLFLPEFAKHVDFDFNSAQPFAYVPLNLVIDDAAFYVTTALGKEPFPSQYVNFVGWLPVLLALGALTAGRDRDERRTIAFLATQVLLALWIASAVPLVWIVRLVRQPWIVNLVAGVRHPSLIAGLAIAPLLALAGISVNRLARAPGPELSLALTSRGRAGSRLVVHLRWLLVIPLGLALSSARSFGSHWIAMRQLPPEVQQLLDALRTPDAQWVDAPYGEQFYVERAVSMGLKLSYGFQTWQWRNRTDPAPVLAARRGDMAVPPDMTQIGSAGGVPLYEAGSGREYAAVSFEDGGRAVCRARAVGGRIDVMCSTSRPGILVVKENTWHGWRATIDGRATPLESGQWLATALPAGNHTVQFRYRPWDVPLGLLLSLIGLGLAVQQWRRGDGPRFAAGATVGCDADQR